MQQGVCARHKNNSASVLSSSPCVLSPGEQGVMTYVKGTVRDNNGERSDAIPYRKGINNADRVKKGLYCYIKKEKGQMPFPVGRALNDANKVKTGLYRYKKTTINV